MKGHEPYNPEKEPSAENRELIFGVSAAGETVRGENHVHNEDMMLLDQDGGTFGVFDGMSRPPGGEVASRIAAEVMARKLKGIPTASDTGATMTAIREAMIEADRAVKEQARGRASLKEIGTTGTVIKILEHQDRSREAVIGHIGDSRAYLFRDGQLNCQTLDHNLANFQAGSSALAAAQQQRFSAVTDIRGLTNDEIKRYVLQNTLTNVLGHDGVPDVQAVRLQAGDILIITSDGIHGNLTGAEIQSIVASAEPAEASSALIAAAEKRSDEASVGGERQHLRAKPDDMTAVVIAVR